MLAEECQKEKELKKAKMKVCFSECWCTCVCTCGRGSGHCLWGSSHSSICFVTWPVRPDFSVFILSSSSPAWIYLCSLSIYRCLKHIYANSKSEWTSKKGNSPVSGLLWRLLKCSNPPEHFSEKRFFSGEGRVCHIQFVLLSEGVDIKH